MMIVGLDYKVVERLHDVFELPLDRGDRYGLLSGCVLHSLLHLHTFSIYSAHFWLSIELNLVMSQRNRVGEAIALEAPRCRRAGLRVRHRLDQQHQLTQPATHIRTALWNAPLRVKSKVSTRRW